MSGGGSSSPSSQTVTQVQQIPQFEQDFAQHNQQLAQSLGAQQYPLYQGPLVAGFTPAQQSGQQQAINASTAYQPALDAAVGTTAAALSSDPLGAAAPTIGAGTGAIGNALSYNPLQGAAPTIDAGIGTIGHAVASNPLVGAPNQPGVIQSYMSPFVQAALAPQITALNEQLGAQQRATNAQATSANAFGDARQGAQNALNNFYGNQSLSGLLASGYNSAFSNALSAAQQQEQLGLGEQQFGLGAGQSLANIGLGAAGAGMQEQGLGVQGGQALVNAGLGAAGAGLQQQGLGLQGGAQFGNLASLAQSLGLGGANAVYDVGQQQQQLQQQQLNTAYQQFLNQVQWPYQQLNVQESALSNSPYNLTNSVTLPQANMTAQNLGSFASLAGGLGSLFSGSGSSAQAPFGGVPYNSGQAHP